MEEIQEGDRVLARSEFDPQGPLELKRVEEKFVRTAAVMELVINGQSIKTTAEHPFYVPAQERFVPAGELRVGDLLVSSQRTLIPIESIASLNEITTVYNLRGDEPHGPLELKRVEELFTRTSPIIELEISGQKIGTTDEHPFYVPAREAFVPARKLQAGDQLISYDGQLLRIDAIHSTLQIATVYNLRVADYHTYFVGCDEWGWSVWAHNQCTYKDVLKAVKEEAPATRLGKTNAQKIARAINRGDTAAAEALLKGNVKGVGAVRAGRIAENLNNRQLRDLTPADIANKPSHSPTVADWIANGGKVKVKPDGTWVYIDAYKNRVAYPGGYPDFKAANMVRQEANIKMKGNRTTDFTAANNAAPLGRKLDTNTSHHHENLITMQEMDALLHARFTHRGAVSIIKNARIP